MNPWVWIDNDLYHRVIYSTLMYFEYWAVGKHYKDTLDLEKLLFI